ncbi:hypothetical protein LO771_03555 [Streptacidiphilus sp. ASG 303]|uniref:hypothetical protein n=1 Tax=Streptacidiphilus sp. ASG 303 TaxID=2896847 RepID=UPI001E65DE93|nr:hypothetical protein [Streptacidiphilus sp. ASG 303]MCD0481506.1 hypothetical protein [Streptacidiphilus sp. ASG 303]
MTVSVPVPRPARSAPRPTRPVRTPWTATASGTVRALRALLLAVLVVLAAPAVSSYAAASPVGLPPAVAAHHGSAPHPAAVPQHGPAAAHTGPAARQGPTATHAPAGPHQDGPALCPVYGSGGVPGSGCSSHQHCLQDAVLPGGPPPCPAAPVLARPLAPPAAPASERRGPLPGSDRAPDLHLLQVQRN